ncbi:MAG: hypothetical protein NVS3B14_00140 [Ktedonobacteraceae bacterium]
MSRFCRQIDSVLLRGPQTQAPDRLLKAAGKAALRCFTVTCAEATSRTSLPLSLASVQEGDEQAMSYFPVQ